MSSSLHRYGTLGILGFRILYGGILLVAPERATERWLGAGEAERAPTRVALRGLGAREVAVHVGAMAAYLQGKPIRPWLAVSIVGDLNDIAATAAGRSGLPDNAAPATAGVAGGSALLTLAIAATAEQ